MSRGSKHVQNIVKMKRASPARTRLVSGDSSNGTDGDAFDTKEARKRMTTGPHWWSIHPFLVAKNAILFVGISFALWQIVARSGSSDGISHRGLRSHDDGGGASDDFCTLYMAPSTLGPHAGFGIFTAKPFAIDDPIKIMDGPSIAVIDPYIIEEAPHLKVLGDKWWAELKGMPNPMRFEASHVTEYVAGFGSLPNFHPYLSNINPREPRNAVDDSSFDRTKSSGAGSFSTYTGKDIYADRDIVAGEELFLNYGESYFDEAPEPEIYKDVPREADYYDASSYLMKFKEELIQAKDGRQLSSREKEMMTGMLGKTKSAIAKAYSARSASLLPGSVEDLANIADAAFSDVDSDPLGSNSEDEPDEGRIRFAIAREMSTQHVTPAWLHSNGFCLDNIVRKPSTIPQAGNGGFAARSLGAGEVIVPVPVYHVADRGLLRTYPIDVDSSTGTFIRNETRLNGPSQLLTNYCFGDDESSLLLCPISSVMHINHCSTRRNGGQCSSNSQKGPNAKLRWASKWHPETKKWLNSSIEEIEKEKDRVLNLEVVATREIEADEEILIDYGLEWEVAWERHKARWSPSTDFPELHKTAATLNKEKADPIPTNDLRTDRSAPGDVLSGCWYWPEEDEDDDSKDNSEDDDDISASEEHVEDEIGDAVFRRRRAEAASNKRSWKSLSDEEIVSQYSIDGSGFVDDRGYVSPHFWPCSVISKDEGRGEVNSTYTVRIFQSKSHHTAPWEREEEPLFLTHYPRSSIRYFIKPYRSIQHQPAAFRRFIGLPNDMWPDNWRNRRRGAQGVYRVGDRVIFLSSSNKVKTGIVVHFDAGEGYGIFSVRSGIVRTGIPPESILKRDLRVKELDIDKFYA